jgi:phage host-nuclease inhibitor protein Gam
MALNKSKIKEDLEQYAQTRQKIEKLESQRNKALDPLIKEHNEKTAPIIAKYDEKTAPLQDKLKTFEKNILDALKANVDAEGNPKEILIETETAKASVVKSQGSRVVDVEKFFAAVKEKNQAFWNCLNVLIGKAETLIGKDKIDAISEKKTSFSLTVSLKK